MVAPISNQDLTKSGSQPEMSLQDKVTQLRDDLILREKIINWVDSEGGLEKFKIMTGEFRGELKALLNIRIAPQEGNTPGQAPQAVVQQVNN